MTYVYVMCDHSAAPPVAPEYKRLCAGEDGDDLLSLYQMSLVELREKYIFKGGEVWTLPASGRRILIREHDERLFALMCHDMNLGRVGSKLPSARSKALLAGTPGMGKSTFMWVAAITFMKMVKANPSEEHIQHVYLLQRNGRTKLKVAVFNPHVSGLRLRWTRLAGAEMVYLGHEPHSMDCLRTVRLFDAGAVVDAAALYANADVCVRNIPCRPPSLWPVDEERRHSTSIRHAVDVGGNQSSGPRGWQA